MSPNSAHWPPQASPVQGRVEPSQVSLLGGTLGFSSIPIWTPGTRQGGWDEPALSREDIGCLGSHGVDSLCLGEQTPPELGQMLPAQRRRNSLVLYTDYVLINGLRHSTQGGHQAFPKRRWLDSWGHGSRPLASLSVPPLSSPGAGIPAILAVAAVTSFRNFSRLLFQSYTALIS